MTAKNIHEHYMRRCIELASCGSGFVSPNPMVGAVVVHNNKIIGEGFHQKYGEPHAEVNAINSVLLPELLKESSIYVNLEPCSHYGKTPPCTDLILEKEIPNIIIGTVDSNSKVAGKGIAKLRKYGRNVNVGILENECRFLNRRFFTFHEKKRPYIILKWAESSDGFIDGDRTKNNNPVWITNETSRTLVHKWRAEEDAIMIGTNTAMLDNPNLNIRSWAGKNPIRIVIDKTGRLPEDLNLFDSNILTICFTESDKQDKPNLIFKRVSFNDSLITTVLKELYNMELSSVIIEGGSKFINSFYKQNYWDELRVFISPDNLFAGTIAPKIIYNNTCKISIGTTKLFSVFNNIK